MFRLLMNLKFLEYFSFFKNDERKVYLPTIYDIISFILELLFISMAFKFTEYISGGKHSDLSLLDSIYFIMTTATTVGYGDISPSTELSKSFVVIFVYLFLSVRLVQIITKSAEAKSYKNKLKQIGRLFMTMQNHVIIYCDADTIKRDNFLWLKRFLNEHFQSNRFHNNPILLVNHNEDANQLINEAMLLNNNFNCDITHLNLNIDEDHFFDKICIETAEQIYILGNSNDTHSDSKVFDIAYRIKVETKYDKNVTAEVVNDQNRERMKKAVGVNVVMRPSRSHPELLVSATIAPGVEVLYEELTSRGGDSFEVFDIPSNLDVLYCDALYHLSKSNIGTLIGVMYDNNMIDANLNGTDSLKNAKRVFIMIHDMKSRCYNDVGTQISNTLRSLIEQK